MLKSGAAVNAKTARPVGSKRIEKPIKTEKPTAKQDEIKEKSNSKATASSSKKTVVTTNKKMTETVTNKPQIPSKAVITKPKQTTPIAPTTKPKIISSTAIKATRSQPVRAVHQVQVKKPVAEKNVMNTIHNVTVASPPSVRKVPPNNQLIDDRFPREKEQTNPQQIPETIPRERTKTRTLGPEEVVILKQSIGDQKLTNLPDSNSPATSTKIEQKPSIVQESIAYEITFEKPPVPNPTINSSSEQQQDASDGDYEDDFDSYESDFETESSTSSQSASSSSNKSEDESKSTSSFTENKPSVFAPPKRLEDDRDFDSGTFELKGVTEKIQLDSIDERELHSEGQNDSGFGYNNATPSASPIDQSNSVSSSIFTKPITKPITQPIAKPITKPITKPPYNKRGMELMKKINLDTMSFSLFELKPLSYDLFMKIYGHRNTNQSSTQTLGNLVDQDVQTETNAKQSMWTQYPPNFVATDQTLRENSHQDRIGCGEGVEDISTAERDSDDCLLEKSLKIINRTNVLRDVRSTKPIDYERLNFFLQKSAITMSAICDTSVATKDLQKSDSTFSDGFYRICLNETKVLDNTAVYFMYSNPTIENILYLAHRQQQSASTTDDNSFVSVWNILDAKKPIHILSCWSLVICLEVHHNFQDVVIGGLTDGCVAVWNCNESTFCHLNPETLPPTHIVSPSVDSKPMSFDYGCIISLKSLHPISHHNDDDNFSSTQICSLHEFGILTVWTVIHTNTHSTTNLESTTIERKIDHRSPWSKVQLIQSSIIDLAAMNLNKKIRPKSGFEKKKMYFESNLFNDAVLRELHGFDAQKELLQDQEQSFRCVDMEYHEDGIVIATNKSFLIFVTTSLHKDSLRKIIIDDSNLLNATKLKSLDDILLVGLTDGSVKVIRVKSSSFCRNSSDKNSKAWPDVPGVAHDNFNAKSCAIQNIIKEERKCFDDKALAKDRFKQIEHVIDDAATSLRGNRFITNQLLLPAMSTNRDFVRWIDVSVNLNCMMSLCGERLRVINFENSVEERVDDGDSHREIGFATIVFGFNNCEYLVNQVEEDSVRVHLLRRKIL